MAGQIWEVAAQGGYMYSDELSDVLRCAVQPLQRFRQFADAEDGTQKGLGAGDQFNWNVYHDVSAHGRQLDEQEKMPETRFTITQSSLTVTEYGNSVPYTGKLDNLSKHPVQAIIRKVLRHDVAKVLDAECWEQFNQTPLTAAPSGGTSKTAVTVEEGGATIQNQMVLLKAHISEISDEMKERDIPGYTDEGDYFAIAWPSTYRDLKSKGFDGNEQTLEDIYQYVETGVADIRAGEIGRYETIRFVEQTNIAKGGALDSTTYDPLTTADPWDHANSGDWVFFFGEDTVTEGIVIPEEMRGKIPDDFGRGRGIAWYYLGGFGIVHTNVDEARIIKWESTL